MVNLLKGIVVKREKSAFTLVELLAVLGIIAIVAVLLVPALTKVRTMAKETQQRAQLNTIELGIMAFKNDEENHYGDFPPSDCSKDGMYDVGNGDYLGAQKLAEALLGWDLMGFDPNSAWRADGKDKAGTSMVYLDGTESEAVREANLKARRGPYLELASANVFKLRQLFKDVGMLEKETFVLCDVFGKKQVTIGGKTVKAGAPILYYRANTSSKTIDASISFENRIYDCYDNDMLIAVKETEDGLTQPLGDVANGREFFYNYISDPKVTTGQWPSNPESYLLISAGADGLYGTKDDICNFDPNVPG